MTTQSYRTKTEKSKVDLALDRSGMNASMSKFIDELFVDKRSLYIESAELVGKTFFIEYCHEWTLNQAEPDWTDIEIGKADVVQYMIDTEANKWERHFMKDGEITSELVEVDAETCLMDMGVTERYYLIREYLERRAKA